VKREEIIEEAISTSDWVTSLDESEIDEIEGLLYLVAPRWCRADEIMLGETVIGLLLPDGSVRPHYFTRDGSPNPPW